MKEDKKKSNLFENLLKGLTIDFDPEKMSFSVNLQRNKEQMRNNKPPSFEEKPKKSEFNDAPKKNDRGSNSRKPNAYVPKEQKEQVNESLELVDVHIDDLDPESDPIRVKIHLKAYIKMALHAMKYANSEIQQSDWVEVIGLLTGHIEKQDSPLTCLVVKDAYPIGHGTNVNAWIRDPQSHVRVYNKLRGGMILGWYHSHPGYSPFMSDTDYATQVRYQKLAKRDSVYEAPVAIVIDHTEISTRSYGIKAFRLQNDLRTWDEPKFEVLNCPLESLPEMLKTLAPLTENKGIFLEYDHE